MRLLTISNLYPRPDRPAHGMYNAQLFDRFAAAGHEVRNWCLVPEFNLFRWGRIARWRSPRGGAVSTAYRPVWYVPVLGRSAAWRTYCASLRVHAGEVRAADMVYATWLFPDAVAAAALARACGRPYGIMVQGSDVAHLSAPWRRRAILAAIRRARAVVCVSDSLRAVLFAEGALAERIHVVPNGVDPSLFSHQSATDARRALALPFDQPFVLFVGHLWPVKTIEVLIQAFALLKPGRPELRLVIVGEGPERGRLEALTRECGLQDDTTFVGHERHSRIPLWINAAECLCLCSRSEGMPNVVIEALTCGCPVAATDVGACRELLAGEPAGRIVPVGDSAALAEAIVSLVGRPADRAAMAARHRDRFSWERQAQTILGLLARRESR